ncbi:hypothetical protein [Endozoicomonas lisbonensis]|uniref:Uncharacterized protein n=1 Tax=Endozoicomonas lisbonensis TaxID=3120522 RepID=A0ABV2SMR7_9GAMM
MIRLIQVHTFILLISVFCTLPVYGYCPNCNSEQCLCDGLVEGSILEWLATHPYQDVENRIYLALLEPMPENQLRSLLATMRKYLDILEKDNPATELLDGLLALSLEKLKSIQVDFQTDAMIRGFVYEDFKAIE